MFDNHRDHYKKGVFISQYIDSILLSLESGISPVNQSPHTRTHTHTHFIYINDKHATDATDKCTSTVYVLYMYTVCKHTNEISASMMH